MDFKKFRESYFFKVGQSRFSILARQVLPDHFCMYETSSIQAPDSSDPLIPDYVPPLHKRITPFHLKLALGLQGAKQTERGMMTFIEHEFEFIPPEFKEVIIKQYIEVTDIMNRIMKEHNDKVTDPTKKLRMNVGKLLVSEPGMPIGQHVHDVKSTVTVVYRFDDDMLKDEDPTHFLMGKRFQTKIYLPDTDRVIFKMTDDPPHHVHSNRWTFWWFNDFTEYVDLPEGLPFTYWEDPALDNKNLI